ncbi:MAG: hypothetical protein Tsb0021_12070 [Chlamydiales bacterium]
MAITTNLFFKSIFVTFDNPFYDQSKSLDKSEIDELRLKIKAQAAQNFGQNTEFLKVVYKELCDYQFQLWNVPSDINEEKSKILDAIALERKRLLDSNLNEKMEFFSFENYYVTFSSPEEFWNILEKDETTHTRKNLGHYGLEFVEDLLRSCSGRIPFFVCYMYIITHWKFLRWMDGSDTFDVSTLSDFDKNFFDNFDQYEATYYINNSSKYKPTVELSKEQLRRKYFEEQTSKELNAIKNIEGKNPFELISYGDFIESIKKMIEGSEVKSITLNYNDFNMFNISDLYPKDKWITSKNKTSYTLTRAT